MADMHYQVFVNTDATALEGGQVYLGAANTDPESNPIPVFWDVALTIPAAQPLRTSGGVIVRDGTPSDVFAGTQAYSIRVRDRAGRVVWYKPVTGGTSNTTRLTFPIPTGPASDVPGPADNTYSDLTSFKASDVQRKTATLVGVSGVADGRFNWTLGDYTALVDDQNVIKANSTSAGVGAWIRQAAKGLTYGRNSLPRPLDASLPVTLSYLGVPNSTGDVSAKLFQALADANGDPAIKGVVADANALYRKDGPLALNGIQFDGQGCTFTQLSTGDCAIRLFGDGAALRNVRHLGGGTGRANGEPALQGVYVDFATRFAIENVSLDGADATKNFPSGGFQLAGAMDGSMRNLSVKGAFADAFHFTRGSRRVRGYNLSAVACGDDVLGFAGYVADNTIPRDITIFGVEGRDCRARGVAMFGSKNIAVYSPRFYGTTGPAVLIGTEVGQFASNGNENCHVYDLYAENCVTGTGQDSNYTAAVVTMFGQSGDAQVDGVTFSKSIVDCGVTGRVEGAGVRAISGLDYNNEFVNRPQFNLTFKNLLNSTFKMNAVLAGGTNGCGYFSGDNIGGLLFSGLAGMRGTHSYDLYGNGIRVQNPANSSAIKFEGSDQMEGCTIRGAIQNTQGDFIATFTSKADQVRYRNFAFNGALKSHDFAATVLTLQNGWTGGPEFSGNLALALRKGNNFVSVQAHVLGGTITAGTVITNLPAGIRPAGRIRVLVATNSGVGTVDINTDGNVAIAAVPAGTTDIYLTNIEFVAS
jgi:hypothetical protein